MESLVILATWHIIISSKDNTHQFGVGSQINIGCYFSSLSYCSTNAVGYSGLLACNIGPFIRDFWLVNLLRRHRRNANTVYTGQLKHRNPSLMFFSLPLCSHQIPWQLGRNQQLLRSHVVDLNHFSNHRLWGYGSQHLLWKGSLPLDRDHGELFMLSLHICSVATNSIWQFIYCDFDVLFMSYISLFNDL